MAIQEKFDLLIRAQDEATATLRRINEEIRGIASESVPKMNRSMDSAGSAFSRAEVKAAILSGRLGGLPPAITQITSAFYLLGPQLAIIAAGVAIVTDEYRNNAASMEAHTKAVALNAAALGELALRNDEVGEAARRRFQEEKKGLEAQLASLEVMYASFTNLEAQKAAYISEFGSDEEAMKGWARAQEGMTKRAREMEAQLIALRDQVAALNKPYEDHAELTNKNSQAIDKLVASRKALMESMLKEQSFRGTGFDTSMRGPGYFGVPQDEVNKAREDAQGAMDSIWAIPEAETRALEEAQARWVEFSSVVMSSTDQLASGIMDMFFGLRDSLTEVFKSMAANWIKYFINEILKQTALRLGFALFNAFIPGAGSLVAGTAGGGDVPIMDGLSRRGTGVDIISSGAKRFSGRGAGPASVNITIAGDVIGDQEYVNRKIIPAIEQAVAYGQSKIQVR